MPYTRTIHATKAHWTKQLGAVKSSDPSTCIGLLESLFCPCSSCIHSQGCQKLKTLFILNEQTACFQSIRKPLPLNNKYVCSVPLGLPAIVLKPTGTDRTTDVQVYERLFTEIMIMGAKLMLWYCTLQRSMSCLPPWFLCNTRTGWLVALWPWCQTGGRGTASGGPGCTSEAPHNICAHPSSRGALLRKQTAVRVYIQKRSLYINITSKVIRCNT